MGKNWSGKPNRKNKSQQLLEFRQLRNTKLETMLAELEKDSEKLEPQTALRKIIREHNENILKECLEKGYGVGDFQVGDFKLFLKDSLKKITVIDKKHTDEKQVLKFKFVRDM